MSRDGNETPKKADPRSAPASAAAALTAMGVFRVGLAAAIGLGPSKHSGTEIHDESTRLAVERSYLAAERTLMAWIRTALSMISFGFTIGKLGQTVTEVEIKGLVFRGIRMISVESIAYLLVILGTMALLGAILQFFANTGSYATMGMRRRISLAAVVGMVLVILGGFALASLVLRL